MIEVSWKEDEFRAQLTPKVMAALAGGRDTAALALAVKECHDAAGALCCGRPMACAAGCPYCCVLNVAVLLPEALLIADFLQARLPAPELDALRKRLSSHRLWARWMDDEERILKHETCPFLDAQGSCSIHTVRPFACRAVTSLDSGSCREAFAPVVSDEAATVPADLLRQAVYDTAFTTLAECLRIAGYDDRSIELGTGVLAFLEQPENRELFLSGGKLPRALWL